MFSDIRIAVGPLPILDDMEDTRTLSKEIKEPRGCREVVAKEDKGGDGLAKEVQAALGGRGSC